MRPDFQLSLAGDEQVEYYSLLFDTVEELDPYLVMFIVEPDCGLPY